MGAWDYGPFDSDSSLDFLADLEHEVGAQGRSGPVDQALVEPVLHAALTAITVPYVPTSKEYRPGTCAAAYAAAGLVAAVLTGAAGPGTRAPGTEPGGTRLIAVVTGDPTGQSLGLDIDCGYGDMLEVDTARRLLPAATAAVGALLGETDWFADWSEPGALRAMVTELGAVLAGCADDPRE